VVAAARQSFGWGPQQLVIGAVGRLEPQKRFDLLIDAVALLQRRRSWNVRLAIAGDGSQATILNARASAALAPGTWIPLGHVGDVRAIYHAVDVFVQSSEYEGTANAVLEAMAYETPIVATDVGGTAELARDRVDAVIVAPGNAEALAAAIESIVLDPEGARRRSLAARRRVEGELSFAARMRTVEQVYRELLAATSPRAELAAAR
jgi:glycosyltransferase involved in cell wall biosynthesis